MEAVRCSFGATVDLCLRSLGHIGSSVKILDDGNDGNDGNDPVESSDSGDINSFYEAAGEASPPLMHSMQCTSLKVKKDVPVTRRTLE
jgi:hypothetical protein